MILVDMKLVLNAAYDTRLGDGIAHYILRLVPPLARLCDLTVLTPYPATFGTELHTRMIPQWACSGSGRLLWTLMSMRRWIPRDTDCIVCPTPVAVPGTRAAVVTVVHDVTPLALHEALSARRKAVFWTLIQTVRWADCIVTDSEHTRTDLLHLNLLPEQKIRAVHAGPGVATSTHGPEFGHNLRPYVLYVGGHALHKNVGRLVAAFARVGPTVAPRLVIAGWSDSASMTHTEEAIRRHGVGDRVTVLPGGLSDEHVSGLYRNCSLFVYPSLYEGFGLPVIEAIAHGAPVACSRASSLPEVGGNAVVYFNPLSTADIAAQMEAVLTNAGLQSDLRRRGLARALTFSWEHTARGIYEAAVEAVRQRRALRRR
jgi:glycosyltransferase involved in cell wall biosynthesis